MPTISSCPFCQAQVAVPVGAEPADEVRCPLCQAQYSLGEVIDIALPELIVVRSVAGVKPQPALVGAASAPNGDAWHAELSYGMPVYRPSGGAGFDMSGEAGADLESADAAATAEAPEELAEDFLTEQVPESSGPAWGRPDQATADEFSDPSADVGIDTGVEAVDPAATGIVANPRKRKAEPNMAIEMLKAVGGGLIGLLIAYAILMWTIGWDPLSFAKKLPKWMVPAKLESR